MLTSVNGLGTVYRLEKKKKKKRENDLISKKF